MFFKLYKEFFLFNVNIKVYYIALLTFKKNKIV